MIVIPCSQNNAYIFLPKVTFSSNTLVIVSFEARTLVHKSGFEEIDTFLSGFQVVIQISDALPEFLLDVITIDSGIVLGVLELLHYFLDVSPSLLFTL